MYSSGYIIFRHLEMEMLTSGYLLNLILQERLRAWETREGKKAKEYEVYSSKEKKKTEEQEREARKLKEFLEDYDDDRDDPKFYKGRELQRRLAER